MKRTTEEYFYPDCNKKYVFLTSNNSFVRHNICVQINMNCQAKCSGEWSTAESILECTIIIC